MGPLVSSPTPFLYKASAAGLPRPPPSLHFKQSWSGEGAPHAAGFVPLSPARPSTAPAGGRLTRAAGPGAGCAAAPAGRVTWRGPPGWRRDPGPAPGRGAAAARGAPWSGRTQQRRSGRRAVSGLHRGGANKRAARGGEAGRAQGGSPGASPPPPPARARCAAPLALLAAPSSGRSHPAFWHRAAGPGKGEAGVRGSGA